MTFKEKLVILRKTRGITQDEFASAVGVSRQAVYKWECGQSYPEVPKLLEIKLLFNISIDNLLDDTYEISLPEKKKRKRLSKEAMRRIEESVESGKTTEEATGVERVEEIARVAYQPDETKTEEKIELYMPEEDFTVEIEVVDGPVEEPAFVAALETPVEAEAVAEPEAAPAAEEPVEAAPVEEAPAEETAPVEATAPEKKKGFFGRLFGKK